MRNKGGALISALFITAIAAMIAVALMVQERLLIHEGELVLNADQSYLNLQSMQLIAENTVKKYVAQWSNPKNLPAQLISLKNKLPELKINNMVLTGTIDDEQGKFNINNLLDPADQPQFVALLQGVIQGISLQECNNITQAIMAWMMNNSQDPYYLSLHPPYRAPQNIMTTISELRLVNGITPTIFSALKPYITALPVTKPETPININSASAPVLLTTDPSLTLPEAESLIACRNKQGGFTNTQAFITQCGTPLGVTAFNNISTTTGYFLVKANAVYDHHAVTLKSLLVTQIEKNNTLNVMIVWQELE